MLNLREQQALRHDKTLDGKPLSKQEREAIMKRFLPPTPQHNSPNASSFLSRAPSVKAPAKRSKSQRKRVGVRKTLQLQLHFFVYTLIHLFFGLYVRSRILYHTIVDRVLAILYYHHRTPDLIRKDVRNLSKLPEHLSVILQLSPDEDRVSALESLVHEVSEVTAWCASAGIPFLSIYERTGILKSYVPQTHNTITRTLQAYFGNTPYSNCPTVSLRAPNQPSFSPPNTPPNPADDTDHLPNHLTILLLSEEDGRSTLVDLTKTLAEMSQRNKILPSDISAELIDAEISESVMGEPDLLLLFGPRVVLDGYPPWQVRLTEIYHVPDNTEGVGYQVFLRAVHRFAKTQMRFGR
jgi:dehydrodolichyl diphosphate syntase complex subunit NUS1